jgi:hypothetical protein
MVAHQSQTQRPFETSENCPSRILGPSHHDHHSLCIGDGLGCSIELECHSRYDIGGFAFPACFARELACFPFLLRLFTLFG